jgi:hypothetical protein
MPPFLIDDFVPIENIETQNPGRVTKKITNMPGISLVLSPHCCREYVAYLNIKTIITWIHQGVKQGISD